MVADSIGSICLGNQVVPQQQLDGCLYGTGRVEIVLLDKLGFIANIIIISVIKTLAALFLRLFNVYQQTFL